jgi:hypothetical protein
VTDENVIVKGVLVHTCYNADLVERLPDKCSCRRFITRVSAEELIMGGLATYVTGYDRPKLYTDMKQICMIARHKRTPRSTTIERPHMERAYLFGGDIEEQTRIEEYGLLTQMTWNELVVFIDEDLFYAQEKLDRNVPVLSFAGEEGTNYGRGKRG